MAILFLIWFVGGAVTSAIIGIKDRKKIVDEDENMAIHSMINAVCCSLVWPIYWMLYIIYSMSGHIK